MSGGFFKGTSLEQDSRFADKQAKLLSSMQFPAEYSQRVDVNKVKLEVLKPWIVSRIRDMLGFDDEVVADLVVNTLEQHSGAGGKDVRGGASALTPPLDPRELQINLTGFLEKNARPFVLELWKMLLSAQASSMGIPQALLDAKKAELQAVQQAAQQQALAQAAAARAAAGLPPITAQAQAPVASVPGKRPSRFGPPPTPAAACLTNNASLHFSRDVGNRS